MSAPASAERPTITDTRFATVCAAGLAALVLALWYWNAVCLFPSIPWNDLRVASAVALAHGDRVYGTADAGVVNTWMYGPLPLVFYAPAAWASSAAQALLVAGGLNVLLTLVPVAVVCFAWPAGEATADSRMGRFAAFLLCVALWPDRHYQILFADNLAIAAGLVGNLLLVRARSARACWWAAAFASAAVGCKQIAIAAPLAQIVWLMLTQGRQAGLRHAGRCALCGVVIAGLAVAWFGVQPLKFTLLELPGGVPWIPTSDQVMPAVPEAIAQFVVPAAIMLWQWRRFTRTVLLLPALAWAFAFPLGLMAIFKFGGRLNSLHSVVLWLPPVLTVALTSPASPQRKAWLPFGAAALAAGLACARIGHAPVFAVRPQVVAYVQGEALARRYPGQIWFPLSPLITLYSDKKYYHDEDGLFVRQLVHRPLSMEQSVEHLPTRLHLFALRVGWSDWGIARAMIPPRAPQMTEGEWNVWDGSR